MEDAWVGHEDALILDDFGTLLGLVACGLFCKPYCVARKIPHPKVLVTSCPMLPLLFRGSQHLIFDSS